MWCNLRATMTLLYILKHKLVVWCVGPHYECQNNQSFKRKVLMKLSFYYFSVQFNWLPLWHIIKLHENAPMMALTEVRLYRWTEHLKLLHRGLALVCSFGLCGQDTCLLCLLSVWLSVPGVEHTVTHTICYLRHSWLGQTRVWVGNGADKTSDLDTVSYVWSTQRERERDREREREVDWWELVVLLILVCARKAAESHVAWKPVYLCVWWETGSFTASLILFNFKDKHQITSLNKCFFFNLMLDIKWHYTIIYASCPFLTCLSILMVLSGCHEGIYPRRLLPAISW